jgi:hypothetical protein
MHNEKCAIKNLIIFIAFNTSGIKHPTSNIINQCTTP